MHKMLKTFWKIIFLSSLILINNGKKTNARTLPVCEPDSGDPSILKDMECITTPEVYKLKVFEMGLCVSDPLEGTTEKSGGYANTDNKTYLTSCTATYKSGDGYEVDLHSIIQTMGEMNKEGIFKAIELNASPYRLDLDWRLCKFAKMCGVPVSINPDAHDIAGLKDVRYGAYIARKGWLEKSDILNSKNSQEVEELFNKRK